MHTNLAEPMDWEKKSMLRELELIEIQGGHDQNTKEISRLQSFFIGASLLLVGWFLWQDLPLLGGGFMIIGVLFIPPAITGKNLSRVSNYDDVGADGGDGGDRWSFSSQSEPSQDDDVEPTHHSYTSREALLRSIHSGNHAPEAESFAPSLSVTGGQEDTPVASDHA
jgi:hypothetical protein